MKQINPLRHGMLAMLLALSIGLPHTSRATTGAGSAGNDSAGFAAAAASAASAASTCVPPPRPRRNGPPTPPSPGTSMVNNNICAPVISVGPSSGTPSAALPASAAASAVQQASQFRIVIPQLVELSVSSADRWITYPVLALLLAIGGSALYLTMRPRPANAPPRSRLPLLILLAATAVFAILLTYRYSLGQRITSELERQQANKQLEVELSCPAVVALPHIASRESARIEPAPANGQCTAAPIGGSTAPLAWLLAGAGIAAAAAALWQISTGLARRKGMDGPPKAQTTTPAPADFERAAAPDWRKDADAWGPAAVASLRELARGPEAITAVRRLAAPLQRQASLALIAHSQALVMRACPTATAVPPGRGGEPNNEAGELPPDPLLWAGLKDDADNLDASLADLAPGGSGRLFTAACRALGSLAWLQASLAQPKKPVL